VTARVYDIALQLAGAPVSRAAEVLIEHHAGTQPDVIEVLDLLPGGDVELVHFSGHGSRGGIVTIAEREHAHFSHWKHVRTFTRAWRYSDADLHLREELQSIARHESMLAAHNQAIEILRRDLDAMREATHRAAVDTALAAASALLALEKRYTIEGERRPIAELLMERPSLAPLLESAYTQITASFPETVTMYWGGDRLMVAAHTSLEVDEAEPVYLKLLRGWWRSAFNVEDKTTLTLRYR
jgi:hypothetical protein